MTIREYQEWVKNCKRKEFKGDQRIRMFADVIAIMSECAEIIDVAKKQIIYDLPLEEIKNRVLDESGDVMWQLTNYLNYFNIDLNDVLEYNKKKIDERWEDR